MERHGLLDSCINNGLHRLPKDPQESYPSSICVTLGDEDQYYPYQICGGNPVLPHELDQIHDFHPFIWLGGGGCLI